MSNLRVFDPLAVDGFEDMFRQFLKPMFVDSAATPQMKLDVEEAPDSYRIKADLPGVKRDDIQVNINGNYVSISAEVKKEKEEKQDGKVLRSERSYGAVSRAFTLASEVDQAKAEAKFENGVLNLTLPKKATAQATRVSVQ